MADSHDKSDSSGGGFVGVGSDGCHSAFALHEEMTDEETVCLISHCIDDKLVARYKSGACTTLPDHVTSRKHVTDLNDAACYDGRTQDTCLDSALQENGKARVSHDQHCKGYIGKNRPFSYGTDNITTAPLSLEDVISDLGGFGVFHVLLLCTLFGAKMSVAYNVLLMAFAAATPDWVCVTNTSDIDNDFAGVLHGNKTGFRECAVNGTECVDFRFSEEMRTIVTEWNLVCDRQWIFSVVTSVQMAGLVVGAAACGQMADWWGRKNTVFLTLLVQAVFSLFGGFATSWQLFAACRFFAGLGSGGYVVCHFPLPMEFLCPRWRSLLGSIPSWPIGICLLSLAAFLLHDWQHLCWSASAFSAVFLLLYPFTPESVRWLVLKGRLREAERIIRNIVAMNRTCLPDMEAVRQVARQEAEKERLCSGMVCYILFFGVEQLSGNLYLNMFLLSVVEIPAMLVTWFLNNRLGRRWTCFLLFTIASLAAFAVIIVSRTTCERGLAVSVLVMVCQLGAASAFSCLQLFSSESFPTVIRSIGYGFCNITGRVGGMIAPYMVLLGTHHFSTMYVAVSAMMGASAAVSLLCRETKGRALDDTIHALLVEEDR